MLHSQVSPNASTLKASSKPCWFPSSAEHSPLSHLVNGLLSLDAIEVDERLDHNLRRKHILINLTKSQVRKAYSAQGNRAAELDVQMTLSKLLQLRLSKPKPVTDSPEGSIFLDNIETIIERGMLASFYELVPPGVIAGAPAGPLEFQQYLRRLIKDSPAFNHPFYTDFLAKHATTQDIRAFLEAEMSIDGRFDDLVALSQIGFSGPAKVVMGENYWDELGRGNPALMHTVLFESAMAEVGATMRMDIEVPVEAYEAGNLAIVLASRRRYSYLAIGFLAATEFLVPHRFQYFMEGWLRNGLSEAGAIYHREHIGIDGVHSRDWFEKLIGPEVEANAAARFDITRGVMFRLRNSVQYLDALLNATAYRETRHAS